VKDDWRLIGVLQKQLLQDIDYDSERNEGKQGGEEDNGTGPVSSAINPMTATWEIKEML